MLRRPEVLLIPLISLALGACGVEEEPWLTWSSGPGPTIDAEMISGELACNDMILGRFVASAGLRDVYVVDVVDGMQVTLHYRAGYARDYGAKLAFARSGELGYAQQSDNENELSSEALSPPPGRYLLSVGPLRAGDVLREADYEVGLSCSN